VFVVLGVALVVDVSRIAVSVRTARRYGSAALRSNAFHFAGDLAGTVAVLVGLGLAAAGFHQGDAAAALVVSAVIFFAATRLVMENAAVLMDATPTEAQDRAREAIAALGPEIELRRLRVRESAGRYFADAVVGVPAGQAVVEAHATADEVEAAVRAALPDSDVVVHLEPRRGGLDLRDRVLAVALAEPLVREAHDITLYRDESGTSISLHLKFPEDTRLADAHEVAERVESLIAAERDVARVQTHLEPLEQPVAVQPSAPERDVDVERSISRLVGGRTGREPDSVRLLHTPDGLVVFLTVTLGEGASLADAHRQAGEIEEDLRREHPFVADVVVHTEP
jgi:divalent metal cation (Fe/Co/Zn/Cd) transporter